MSRTDAAHHLAFGKGLHYCLGANLGKLEAQIAVTELARRYPALRLAPDQPLSFHPNISFRGPRSCGPDAPLNPTPPRSCPPRPVRRPGPPRLVEPPLSPALNGGLALGGSGTPGARTSRSSPMRLPPVPRAAATARVATVTRPASAASGSALSRRPRAAWRPRTGRRTPAPAGVSDAAMSMTSASGGRGAGRRRGRGRVTPRRGHRGGRRGAGASQLTPFGIGLGGLPEQAHVTEQHDGRRHDHPPGGHPGERERAGPDGQHQQHAEQPPPRGQHLLVLLVPRPAAGDFSPDFARARGWGCVRVSGRTGARGVRRLLVARRARLETGRIFAAPRRGSGLRDNLGLGLGFRRGEVLAIALASRRIPPKPPGDEHASPDGDDGDVEYRAAQQSSPRRGRRRACSCDAK